MKKLLFIIITIFSLHCPGYSMYSQAGIFTDGTDWPEQACEEGGSEQQGPSNISIVQERTETESSSLSETEAKAVTKSNYTATTVYCSGGSVGYHEKQFLDGLGNPSEKVYVRYTPNKKDLYSLQEYDAKNRIDKIWLPLPTTRELGDELSAGEFKRLSATYYGDSYTYATTEYTKDPLNRIEYTRMPGTTFHSVSAAVTNYDFNLANVVPMIVVRNVNGTVSMNVSEFYPANMLALKSHIDEDQRRTRVYTDKSGKVIMTTAAAAKTCYGYDDQGRLSVVITPEGIKALLAMTKESRENIAMNSDFVKKYCYYYRYDEYGDLVEQRIPGGPLEEMIYNDKGQLITRFRGKTAVNGLVEYADRYAYDAQGRISSVRSVLFTISNGKRIESVTSEQMSFYRYDSYRSIPDEVKYKADLEPGLVDMRLDTVRIRGLKTYESLRVINGSNKTEGFINRAFYYDTYGRLLQTVERNHLGGVSYFTYAYDFTGNIVYRRERVQLKTGMTEDVLTVRYTYDHAGRLLTETTTCNDSKAVTTVYEYNEMGQLIHKNTNGIQESFAYNLQGWLTEQHGPYYGATLKYYDSSQPSYTGNITEWNFGPHTYRFTYDDYSRMTDAVYSGESPDKYSEKGITYDLNGNILTLKRYSDGVVSEDLRYTYTADKLTKVNDATYTYDACGNLTKDGRNGLDIEYNIINLPARIKESDSGRFTEYCYVSDGTKFSALESNGTGLYYIGSLVYQALDSDTFKFESAGFSKGRFRRSTSAYFRDQYVPEYYITDHLGSRRAMIDHTGELMVLKEYYPFGKTWDRPHAQVTSDPYGYNGKEEQSVGDAGLLDYGARFYDPGIGRWLTQDPLAEKYYSISPYVYCVNNPVRHIDPNGMEVSDEDWDILMMYVNLLLEKAYRIRMEIFLLSSDMMFSRYSGGGSEANREKIAKLQKDNEEIERAIHDLFALIGSSQMYEFQYKDEIENGYYVGKFWFDFERGVGVIQLPASYRDDGLALHELMHAYQFDTGRFSYGLYKVKGASAEYALLLSDRTDEIEAYRRGAIFGQINDIQNSIYDDLPVGPISITNHPEFQKALSMPISSRPRFYQQVANGSKHAFRVNGETYYPGKL